MQKQVIKIQNKISPILKEYGVKRAGIFGSYARGDFKRKSDIDILVELDERYGLGEIIDIKLKLEKVLKKKVDLVEYELIRKELKKRILNEEVRII
ncbi:MAG: nucleotidyltransferase domain-containing protein [Nanoarchaeota archaeon]|nr:nucleotidyltransferase domain-containing protein [Nanoarchaeota archaeon]